MDSMITFKCPYCNKSTQLSSDLVGKKGRCPHCKTVSRITPVSKSSDDMGGVSLAPEVERPKIQKQYIQQVKYTLPHDGNKRIKSYAIKAVGVLITLGLFVVVGDKIFEGLTSKGQTELEKISSQAIKRLRLIYADSQIADISTESDRGIDNLNGEMRYTIKWIDESVDEYRATFFYDAKQWVYLKTDTRQLVSSKPDATTAERKQVVLSKVYGLEREPGMWRDLGVLQPESSVTSKTEQMPSEELDERPGSVELDETPRSVTAAPNESVGEEDHEQELPFSLPKEAALERFALARKAFNQKVNSYSVQIKLFQNNQISADAFLLLTEQFIPHLVKSELLIDTNDDRKNWDEVKKYTLLHAETALRKAIEMLDADTKTNAAERFKNSYQECMRQIGLSKQQDVDVAIEKWMEMIDRK